jgi:hypothetical protein
VESQSEGESQRRERTSGETRPPELSRAGCGTRLCRMNECVPSLHPPHVGVSRGRWRWTQRPRWRLRRRRTWCSWTCSWRTCGACTAWTTTAAWRAPPQKTTRRRVSHRVPHGVSLPPVGLSLTVFSLAASLPLQVATDAEAWGKRMGRRGFAARGEGDAAAAAQLEVFAAWAKKVDAIWAARLEKDAVDPLEALCGRPQALAAEVGSRTTQCAPEPSTSPQAARGRARPPGRHFKIQAAALGLLSRRRLSKPMHRCSARGINPTRRDKRQAR